ncbi:MAG: hypothetical protein KGN74_11415 [Gemmatimonadota bacterium]|nr:hypothetical protein [Gemmatimonadota bacterium]
MARLRNRAGFALPMAILVIAVITAALAAAFLSTNAEISANQAEKGTERAFEIAQNGLQQFLVRRSEPGWCLYCGTPPTVTAESTKVVSNGGYAWVVSRRIHPSTATNDPAVYFVMSTGVDTTTLLSAGGRTFYATRAVGTYARWNTTVVNVLSGWTSLSGIQKNGTAGVISGVDQCGKDTSLAGVTVPSGGWSTNGGFSPQGNPPVDSNQTALQLAAQTKIDWPSILAGSIPADVEIPPGTFPSASAFTDTTYWPVIRIHTNNYSLPNAGRGIIIADSNFVISGSNMWNGILLVGGKLTSNGNNTTAGATISGLNVILGDTTGAGVVNVDTSVANGQKSYVYNSCNVSRASQRLQSYMAYPNAWADNIAIY